MQDILHIFRCYFVQQITFFSKLHLIGNFAQLTSFLLHFSTLTQQLYLSKASVFERSFENLIFLDLGSQNNSQKTCCLNLPNYWLSMFNQEELLQHYSQELLHLLQVTKQFILKVAMML